MYQKNPLLESKSFNRYISQVGKRQGEAGLVRVAQKICKKHPQGNLPGFYNAHDRKLAAIGREIEKAENRSKSVKIAGKVLRKGK